MELQAAVRMSKGDREFAEFDLLELDSDLPLHRVVCHLHYFLHLPVQLQA